MSVESEYKKLAKSNKALPDWAWLKKNFKVKDEGEALEAIRVAIGDKIDSICKGVLEPIISGADNYCCWYERKMLSNKDAEHFFNAYKDFQSILWQSNKISMSSRKQDYIKWIISVEKVWKTHAPILETIFEKLSQGWSKYKKKQATTAYHG